MSFMTRSIVRPIVKKSTKSVVHEVHAKGSVDFRCSRVLVRNGRDIRARCERHLSSDRHLIWNDWSAIFEGERYHSLDVLPNQPVICRVSRTRANESVAESSQKFPECQLKIGDRPLVGHNNAVRRSDQP